MQLDAAIHSRLSLTGLLAVLLACASTGDSRIQPVGVSPPSPLESGLAWGTRRSFEADLEEAVIVARLADLSHRNPSSAEWSRVLAYLEHSSWRVVESALRVVRIHQHPARTAAQNRLLERTLTEFGGDRESWASNAQRLSCFAVLRDVLDHMESPVSSECTELLARVIQCGPDGQTRARAMRLLASRPPNGWRELVLKSLNDPSERVLLTTIDLIAANEWCTAYSAIESLASSARPVLRQRAAEALEQFGKPLNPHEYGESVVRAASALENKLWQVGLDFRDVIVPPGSHQVDDIDLNLLDRQAEEYLDRSFVTNSASADYHGILLLAAASHAGLRKLTLRLWEHEIERTDSDEELLERGMETLARNRLLAALAAYQQGDRADGLQKLASISKLAHGAPPGTPRDMFVRQASELSTAIWQCTLRERISGPPRHPPLPADPVARLANQLLDNLDLTNADGRAEARRRLDAWCGLAPLPHAGDGRTNRMAN